MNILHQQLWTCNDGIFIARLESPKGGYNEATFICFIQFSISLNCEKEQTDGKISAEEERWYA